ncbi:MAG: hypothetical protein IV093_09220 [Rubrivivax sp.]|nr:hypothetical protein [Rubrivivax sp.]
MFTTPNVHSAASSAMALAFRNAAQPLQQSAPCSMTRTARQRVLAAWAWLVLPKQR